MAQPCAPPEDVQRRIERLHQHMDDYPQQAQNIVAIVDFYRCGGALPSLGHVVFAHGGKVGRGTVDEVAFLMQREEPGVGPHFDMAGQQLSNHHHCPSVTSSKPLVNTINPGLVQTPGNTAVVPWAESAVCPKDDVLQMHKIWAQFRLPLFLGGSDNPHIVTHEILNDTGSSVQGMYRHDWEIMNVHKWAPSTMEVAYATGRTGFVNCFIGQIRIVKFDQITGNMEALTGWLNETFVIKDASPDGPSHLLSGNAMREALYFATAPGNKELYISVKKSGLVEELPSL